MILVQENNQEIIIGGGKQSSFSIDDSSSMIFDILRNKLYSNKIGAIAREIASNSRDANREAGNDVPIEIEFTNDNFLSAIGDTSIIFRDFGFGISPDRMENIFLKYGASSKRDSNLQTGGFGLGAKVPMAYTDSFVIRTRNNNIEYVYNAIIDSTGKGKVILISEEESFEPSGTEITIPILSNEDRYKFEKEVYKYTMHWEKVKYSNFKTQKPHVDYILDNEVFKLIPFTDSHFVGLLDGIPYEIKPNATGIAGHTVLINLDLDKVTINANRESLQYDDKTSEHVNSKIDLFKQTLETIVVDYLSDNENFIEAYKKFKHISHKNHATNSMEELIGDLKNTGYKFNYKVIFDGKEVEKVSLHHHQLVHVKHTDKGSKYNSIGFTMDYPLVYLDKGAMRIPKNEKLGEFLMIKPDKSVAKEALLLERQYLESLGLEITNYSDVKADRVYVKPVKSEKVKIYLRGDNFRWDKLSLMFDKTTKLLANYSTEEVVFRLVDDFKSRYGYSSSGLEAEKYTILRHETKVKKVFYVSRSNWEKYLEPAGYKKLSSEIAKIDFEKYSKYTEKESIEDCLSKIPSIISENFPELLPVSIIKMKDVNFLKVPKGLESVRWSRFDFKTSKFDYNGVIKKYQKKLRLNYPMLPSYIKSTSDDREQKIKNIKNYINLVNNTKCNK